MDTTFGTPGTAFWTQAAAAECCFPFQLLQQPWPHVSLPGILCRLPKSKRLMMLYESHHDSSQRMAQAHFPGLLSVKSDNMQADAADTLVCPLTLLPGTSPSSVPGYCSSCQIAASWFDAACRLKVLRTRMRQELRQLCCRCSRTHAWWSSRLRWVRVQRRHAWRPGPPAFVCACYGFALQAAGSPDNTGLRVGLLLLVQLQMYRQSLSASSLKLTCWPRIQVLQGHTLSSVCGCDQHWQHPASPWCFM